MISPRHPGESSSVADCRAKQVHQVLPWMGAKRRNYHPRRRNRCVWERGYSVLNGNFCREDDDLHVWNFGTQSYRGPPMIKIMIIHTWSYMYTYTYVMYIYIYILCIYIYYVYSLLDDPLGYLSCSFISIVRSLEVNNESAKFVRGWPQIQGPGENWLGLCMCSPVMKMEDGGRIWKAVSRFVPNRWIPNSLPFNWGKCGTWMKIMIDFKTFQCSWCTICWQGELTMASSFTAGCVCIL